MKIGFIGLGRMGGHMAANLIRAGHEVVVWNRSAEKARPLIEAGASLAETPAQAAAGDVVMSMLADDRAVESVIYGDHGTLGGSALHVSHSTISVDLAERLEHDHVGHRGYVSAPVFGRPPAAAEGKLFVVAAGTKTHLDVCQQLFSLIGPRTFRVGEKPASANLVKLSGNFMIMAAVEAMAEAMTLCETGGVERQTLLNVLTGTLFDAPIYKTYGNVLVEDHFRPAGFTAPLGLKDMTLVDQAATRQNVPMPFLGIVRDHLRSVIATEGPDVDWGAVALAVRNGANIKRKA